LDGPSEAIRKHAFGRTSDAKNIRHGRASEARPGHPAGGPGSVYILASKRNGTLYTGVTNNISIRVADHKAGLGSKFTRRYGVTLLVWHEFHDTIESAIQRETSIKRWPRKWKLALIERDNPDWDDLFDKLGEMPPLPEWAR
jgi:putative endonuclease